MGSLYSNHKLFNTKMKLIFSTILALVLSEVSADVIKPSKYGKRLVRKGKVRFLLDDAADSVDECYVALGIMDRSVLHKCIKKRNACICKVEKAEPVPEPEVEYAEKMIENNFVRFTTSLISAEGCYEEVGPLENYNYDCIGNIMACPYGQKCEPKQTCFCSLDEEVEIIEPVLVDSHANVMIAEGKVNFEIKGQNEPDCYINLGVIRSDISHKCDITLPQLKTEEGELEYYDYESGIGFCSCYLTDDSQNIDIIEPENVAGDHQAGCWINYFTPC